jgi:hypothetical protein
MLSVRKLYPHVIDAFAETVIGNTKIAPPGSASKKLPDTYEQWARKYELESDFIAAWAFRTLTQWTRNPKRRQQRDWVPIIWGEEVPNNATASYPSSISLALSDSLDPIEAHPEIESKQQFLERAQKHWRSRLEHLMSTGRYELTPTMVTRHLAWLARFHIGKQNYSQIAASETPQVGQPVVASAVKSAAQLLGLKIRNSRRGRPRSR